MLVIIKIGEGYQPLPVGIAGTGTANGMIGGDIYFRRFGERISDTCAPLFVHSPVSGEIGEQKLEVEVQHDIVDEYQACPFVDVIPDKAVVEDVRPFPGYIDCIDNLAHQFTDK